MNFNLINKGILNLFSYTCIFFVYRAAEGPRIGILDIAGFENFNSTNGLEAAYIYQLLPREDDLLIASAKHPGSVKRIS